MSQEFSWKHTDPNAGTSAARHERLQRQEYENLLEQMLWECETLKGVMPSKRRIKADRTINLQRVIARLGGGSWDGVVRTVAAEWEKRHGTKLNTEETKESKRLKPRREKAESEGVARNSDALKGNAQSVPEGGEQKMRKDDTQSIVKEPEVLEEQAQPKQAQPRENEQEVVKMAETTRRRKRRVSYADAWYFVKSKGLEELTHKRLDQYEGPDKLNWRTLVNKMGRKLYWKAQIECATPEEGEACLKRMLEAAAKTAVSETTIADFAIGEPIAADLTAAEPIATESAATEPMVVGPTVELPAIGPTAVELMTEPSTTGSQAAESLTLTGENREQKGTEKVLKLLRELVELNNSTGAAFELTVQMDSKGGMRVNLLDVTMDADKEG